MTVPERLRLNGNTLKLLAVFFMVFDHACTLFFPEHLFLRAIGRPGFAFFAFLIAEGCRYTRHRLRHFLLVFSVAAVCQVAYTVATGDTHLNALLTFSLAILLCYALDVAKTYGVDATLPLGIRLLGVLLFPLAMVAAWLLTDRFSFDYGFYGAIVPVFASLFHSPRGRTAPWSRLDRNVVHVATLSIGLILLAYHSLPLAYFMLLGIPFLLLYSGKRGRWRMKYFFYIAYPAHFLVLMGIYLLLQL